MASKRESRSKRYEAAWADSQVVGDGAVQPSLFESPKKKKRVKR